MTTFGEVNLIGGISPASSRSGLEAFAEIEETVLLASIVESSSDAIISKDLNGIIRSWNKGAERIFGYSAEEIIGKPLTILAAPEVVNEIPDILARVRGGERVDHYETVRCRKDGQRITVSLTISPIRNRAGEIIGASKIARDISQTKHLERTLHTFDEQLMLLTDASRALFLSPHTADVLRSAIELARRFGSADGYAVWRKGTVDGIWTLVSSAGLSDDYIHSGVTSDSVARPLAKGPMVFEDVAGASFLAMRQEALKREGICSMLVIPLQVHGEPTGTITFYWKTPHRLTESEMRIAEALGNLAGAALGAAELYERETGLRREAEASEKRAEFLAEAGAVLAGSLDYETTLRSVARLAIAAFADWCAVDVTREGKLERVTLEHIEPEKVQLAREYRKKYPPQEDDLSQVALRTGDAVLIEQIPEGLLRTHIQNPEQLRMLQLMGIESLIITPMVNRGRALGLLTFVNSKPDRSYTKMDLALAQELARLASLAIENARLFSDSQQAQAALRSSNEELRRANDDLNQFAYSASHDLQEPLRMVAAYSQLLQKRYDGRLDSQADQYIKYTVQGAHRMEALIRDILAYTKATSTGDGEAGVLDANSVLEKVLSNLQQSIEKNGATIESGPLPALHIAEVHLLQVFQNLISNAIKYAGDNRPRIQVQARYKEGAWLFSVHDNGIGVEPQYKEQIFGLFKRLHTAAKYEGTGLGLAICQKIVWRYGGRIWVESEVGHGATFYFTIPDQQVNEPADRHSSSLAEDKPGSGTV